METSKTVITGKPLMDLDSIPDMLGGVVDSGIDRSFAPAGRLIDPEKAAQAVKDSVDRGSPTREIATASRYLMLDGRKAAAQIQSILGVMSELEGLEEH